MNYFILEQSQNKVAKNSAIFFEQNTSCRPSAHITSEYFNVLSTNKIFSYITQFLSMSLKLMSIITITYSQDPTVSPVIPIIA